MKRALPALLILVLAGCGVPESEEPVTPTVVQSTPSASIDPEGSPPRALHPTETPTHPIQSRPAIPANAQRARVSRNVDGDTIWAEPLEAGSLPLGAAHSIRILEIDTPEVYGGTVECYGPEASAFAKRELPVGSTIYLLPDKEDKDQYGRFLRYVWQEDGDFYNDMAVRQGFARAVLYMPNELYINRMREAEAEAKANNRGLWGACSGVDNSGDTTASPPPPPDGNCHPSYPDFCIPPPPPDLDCKDFTQKNFTVRWDVADPDPHGLDGDKDGKACEG